MSSGASKNDVQNLGKADFDRKSPLEKLQAVRKLTDPRFGEIQILQNPASKEFVAAQELKFNDQKSAGEAVLAARARLALRHPNLVGLLDYSVTKQSELCSTFYLVKLFYDYPKSDLKKESLDRERKGEMFSGEELKLFFSQQSAALDYLHEGGRFHGDVQPLLIGFNRDQASTKLIDRPDIDTPDKIRAIQKNRFVKGDNMYVSPATFSALASGNPNYPVDPITEDSYGLGLTILELGNQRSVQDVYDRANNTINQAVLQNHITEFHSRYADKPELVDAMVGLTNLDERNRVMSAQVTQFLVNGTNLHTIITTKVEALPMDGISLFENIDENLGRVTENGEALPEKKEAFVNAELPPDHSLSASGAESTKNEIRFAHSGKHLVNVGEISERVVQGGLPGNRPSHIVTTSATTYYYGGSNGQPANTYHVASPNQVSNVSHHETRTSTMVYSVPPQTTVYSPVPHSPEPKIVSSYVAQVLTTPTELSGLRLVRTYEDPTNASP
jgi:serine/threonine protein kinase